MDPKTICIIGAGPAGLAALKTITDSPQYKARLWKPTAFEARDGIGGVWLPAPPPLTPLYDSLTTNLPHSIMAFPSFSFPASTPVFPHASAVLEYLNDYAHHFHLTPHIRLNTTVKAVHRDPSNTQWQVTISAGDTTETLPFDLVIVCNGHYCIPRYPNIPGLTQWFRAGKATHSVYYRRPHDIGNTVLIVGGGPSGQDISSEMRPFARTVIHSATGAPYEDTDNFKSRGRVTQFHDNTHQVTFEDGTSESEIDHCILATGYEFSFPFLPNDILLPALPKPIPPLPRDLYNTTYSVFPLAKHLFPSQSPGIHSATAFPSWSIAFMGLLIRVAPFPVFESQARAIFHTFAHPAALDPTREAVDIMTRHEALRLRLGSDDPLVMAKAWHRFESLEQFEYRDALSDFTSGDSPSSDRKVPEWEKEMYMHKDVLRSVWVELERRGEGWEWVKDVGKGDREGEEVKQEWVELTRRMLRWKDKL